MEFDNIFMLAAVVFTLIGIFSAQKKRKGWDIDPDGELRDGGDGERGKNGENPWPFGMGEAPMSVDNDPKTSTTFVNSQNGKRMVGEKDDPYASIRTVKAQKDELEVKERENEMDVDLFDIFDVKKIVKKLEEQQQKREEDVVISEQRSMQTSQQSSKQLLERKESYPELQMSARMSPQMSTPPVPNNLAFYNEREDEIKRGEIGKSAILSDFDLRKAIIYSEIMQPKWRE